MAGAGFKDFTVGEVLTSADVDTYLMQQTVMRFADSAARGSALGTAVGTAVALAEGMVSYLQDTDMVEVYDGTGWVSVAPGVVQVVYASTDTTTSTTSTTRQNTSLTGTITPADTSNQVLVVAYFSEVASTNTGTTAVVDIYNGTSDSTVDIERVDTGTNYGMSITYLDSPASASAVTYTARIRRVDASATVSVSGWQTLVLMEVAA